MNSRNKHVHVCARTNLPIIMLAASACITIKARLSYIKTRAWVQRKHDIVPISLTRAQILSIVCLDCLDCIDCIDCIDCHSRNACKACKNKKSFPVFDDDYKRSNYRL